MSKAGLVIIAGLVFCFCSGAFSALTTNEINAAHAQIKARYLQFLKGTPSSFDGPLGTEIANRFVGRVDLRVRQAQAFDFSADADIVFSLFPEEVGFEEEKEIYSVFLQSWLPGLALAYTVDAPGNSYYLDPAVKDLYFQALEYLYGRGIKSGMTFHRNATRQLNNPPPPGCANIVDMELRMGSLCQSVLLMEEYAAGESIFEEMRALVEFLEMLGYTSGHVEYWIPYNPPPGLDHLVQSDAMQIYPDVTFVSAMLKTNVTDRHNALLDAQNVFTDSLKIVPGWADTIKPDFTGFHHRGIYGNSYTGGFLPQAAFGVYALQGTPYAVDANSVSNLRELALTYRLYCQKFGMPFGIRGRFPEQTNLIREDAFGTYVLFASSLGINDESMHSLFKRLWDVTDVNVGFVFDGGRGKILRGLYLSNMLKELDALTALPEDNPEGFWMKPYGGLAIHRRDNWMAAVKGYGKYVWDYETGGGQNEYGQYLSHGMLTIFNGTSEYTDKDSGYDLSKGWDWYRQPGTTAVRFPLTAKQTDTHRTFSPETFMGGVSMNGQNGVFGMILNDPEFGDGISINLKARKSVFFSDDLIVMLGTGISGGDGQNRVETTLFQSCHTSVGQTMKKDGEAFADGSETVTASGSMTLADPFGNGYYIPDAQGVKLFQGVQNSFDDNGSTPTSGEYSTVVFDHGLSPAAAEYEAAILVGGGETVGALAAAPAARYQVQRKDDSVHQVYFPQADQTAYVFFDAAANASSLVERVDTPCLVMTEPVSNGWKVAVANPDLGIVDASQEMTFDWINDADERQYLPSTVQPVEVRLQGLWELRGTNSAVSVTSYAGGDTLLRFDCVDGAEVAVEVAAFGEETAALDFRQIAFEDDFNSYAADAPVPVDGQWTSVSYYEPSNVFVHVRTDTGNVFGEGAGNKYLGCRDAGGRTSNLLAQDILDADAVRVSFDFMEPDNELTGALSVRVGVNSVKVADEDVVGGIRPVDGFFDPAGTYECGAVVHADIYFNEQSAEITYIAPDGNPSTLAAGKMDVWLNGINTGDDVVNDRFLGTASLSPIRSLRFETYSAGQNEVWFDNLEVAVGVPVVVGDPFAVWAVEYGLVGDDAAQTADPDGDGMNNLLEFALGGIPTNRSDSAAILPILGEINPFFFEYIHRRRVDSTLKYSVERTGDLVSGNWATGGVAVTGYGPDGEGFERVTNSVPAEGANQFVRLKITGE
ncbi:polysaccharide lyase family 8 super-sandwich domain-containing protein [Tichowtungia aerotolerans]|uniref:Uncharacterized protein n=1 Tax=Tichowtungia aerotolerans TaxID=2697043 RepID=A0A6P1M655_9BACT|nr:polysaccharide lyase family 8 super-sandwich domain-containing protein [Tichowtungia aerotolerans]QHI69321.1 hypothetical protein GT409_07605 [Tichowtungia aerotolerans]